MSQCGIQQGLVVFHLDGGAEWFDGELVHGVGEQSPNPRQTGGMKGMKQEKKFGKKRAADGHACDRRQTERDNPVISDASC
ncbi:hypothetical protein NBRC116584_25900 [Hydrogenophaga sp. 5NK40-0174]